jgi:ADP-L-glycero-D-manno-heptose 6-epimerase
MNILITGYKGFIGQNMVKAMSDHNLYFFEWGENLDTKIFKKLDWVVHLGAISSTTETNVEKVYNQNVEFTLTLALLCRQYNVNLQYASSERLWFEY